MMMLNPVTYLKSGYKISNNIILDNNNQEIFSKMGSYYSGTKGCKPDYIESGESFNCTEVDFTSTGLKNDTTRNAIEEVVWNLGGADVDDTPMLLYEKERGTKVYSGHATIWTGKIGLIYPSDFAYATSGGIRKNRSVCLVQELGDNWDWRECGENDYVSDSNQMGLTPLSYDGEYVINVSNGLGMFCANCGNAVRPALFLKSNIIVKSGTGSENDPYQLKIN